MCYIKNSYEVPSLLTTIYSGVGITFCATVSSKLKDRKELKKKTKFYRQQIDIVSHLMQHFMSNKTLFCSDFLFFTYSCNGTEVFVNRTISMPKSVLRLVSGIRSSLLRWTSVNFLVIPCCWSQIMRNWWHSCHGNFG